MEEPQKERSREDILSEAINIVKNEIKSYKDGEFFITENVSIATRPLIRILRKNYWGVFDQPIDPITKKKKQWVPLTRLVVDSARKNSDIDLNNLNYKANGKRGVGVTSLVRGFVRGWLRRIFFGEALDESILQMCIDGTSVWKTYTIRDNGKLVLKRKSVDILNTFIDPTANSIQEAQRFTERALMSPIEIEAMTGWANTEGVKTSSTLHRTEADLMHTAPIGEFVDVYDLWGIIPKRLIPGRQSEKGVVEGHIVVSGIETGDTRVHLIEENKNKDKAGNIIKPYEEMRYMKVPGRWAGVGPAEMVMGLQEWINIVVNLRIIKNTTAALGLFKIRAGSGVTQQMLSNLVSRGVIKLNNMDDLDNLQVSEAGESSYKDEDVAKGWAFDVTSTYDIARGAPGTSTATATASVIEDRNSQSTFALVVESVGHMLTRWMDRHVLVHIPKMMREAKTTMVYNDFDDIEILRERVVSYLMLQMLDEMDPMDVPSEQEMMVLMQRAEKQLRDDKDLFFDIVEDIVVENIDTEASFTNETTDVSVITTNLLSMASQIEDPAARNDFYMQALDLMGLQIPESLRNASHSPEVAENGIPTGNLATPPIPGLPTDQLAPVPTAQSVTTSAAVPSL